MSTPLDCRRAEELLSDHFEGTLDGVLQRDVDTHLGECRACATLLEDLRDVVQALQAFPTLEPARDLADRAATRALLAPRLVASRPPRVAARTGPTRYFMPSWLQAAAAGFVLVIGGSLLLVAGPEGPSRAASRLVVRTVSAGSYLLERSDRLVEDVRILGVVITTAFEGRLDRVNDRMDDYRKHLERRRSLEADSKKRESGFRAPLVRSAEAFRTPTRGDS
jgi:Putative zinc-finger